MKFYAILLFVFVSSLAALPADNPDYKDDDVDKSIFDKIKVYLSTKYFAKKEMADCVFEYFRTNQIVDRFYRPELLNNPTALKSEVDKHTAEAESNCDKTEPGVTTPKAGPEPEPSTDGFPTWAITLIGVVVAILVAAGGFFGYKKVKN